jgi:hypothetical protein
VAAEAGKAMKILREIFGGFAAAIMVAMLAAATVVCTFAIGFVTTAVRSYTQADRQTPSAAQTDIALTLAADR